MRFTRVFLLVAPALALAVALLFPSRGTGAPPAERRAVLVELFTSEGCSSCPPADAVLARLAREQPVAGAEVIALELHVDYWNQLGWPDPFSSAAFTARQRAYADTFGQRGVYTPQMVIDGASELLGSDERGARSAIAGAARAPHARVAVERAGDKLTIRVGELPDPSEDAEVLLAIAEEGLSTAVPRGENAGATLAHGPVARSLARVLSIKAGTRGPVEAKDVAVSVDPGWKRENLRAVAFVAQRSHRRVLGAAAIALK